MSVPRSPLHENPDPVDDDLTALGGSHTLALLWMTTDDLARARTDPTLQETFNITHALLGALRDEGVLGIFLSLPPEKQANFVRWIGTIDGEDVRRDLTDTLVEALQESPLGHIDPQA